MVFKWIFMIIFKSVNNGLRGNVVINMVIKLYCRIEGKNDMSD